MWETLHSLALCTHNRMNQSGIAFDRGDLLDTSFDTTLCTELLDTNGHTEKDSCDRKSAVFGRVKNKIRFGDLGSNEQFVGGHKANSECTDLNKYVGKHPHNKSN